MRDRQLRHLSTCSVIALGLAGLAAPALAETRVAVVGDDAPTVKAIADVLRKQKDVAVVDVAAPPVVREERAKELAKANGLNAVVAVRVSVEGATWTAAVTAYEGDDAVVLASYEVKAPVSKLAAAAATPAWKKMGKELQAAEAPAATLGGTEPGTATATDPGTGTATGTATGTGTVADPGTGTGTVADPGTGTGTGAATDPGTGTAAGTVTDPGAGTGTGTATSGAAAATGGPAIVKPVEAKPGRGAVRVGAALQPFRRRLRYTDDIRDATRPHDLTVPAVGLDVRWLPVASRPIEVNAAVQLSLGGSSAADDSSMEYDTRATAWSIGAGYGFAAGPAQVVGSLGYGQQTFRIADDEQPGPEEIPDMDYRFVRIAADAAMELSPKLDVEAAFGYRYLLEAGDLDGDPWFPRATGSGIDGDVGVRFALKPRIDLFAQLQIRHYFFSMNPEPGDSLIVGGAIDTFIGGSIGASLTAF